jgi:hypothetical protein
VRLNARGKDTRSLIANVTCAVKEIPTDDERWEQVTQKALLRRLNLSDFGDETIARWRTHCQLLELTPQFGSDQPAGAAATPAAATGAATQAAAAPAAATASREDEIHVEAEVDQAVMDKLVAEGMPERVARAKAKAHYVRSERARIKAEQTAS